MDSAMNGALDVVFDVGSTVVNFAVVVVGGDAVIDVGSSVVTTFVVVKALIKVVQSTYEDLEEKNDPTCGDQHQKLHLKQP